MVQHQSVSQANLLIQKRQSDNRILWREDPWRLYRLIFLWAPEQRGGCAWCGNWSVHLIVCHPGDSTLYRNKTVYVNFRQCGCYLLCHQCANAERQGKVICPRCRRQGHYVPAGRDGNGDGEVCWDCKPPEIKERLIFNREHRIRERSRRDRQTYRKYHPEKTVDLQTGKWVFKEELHGT